MKFILIICLLSTLIFSCSNDVEEKKVPDKKSIPIKSKPVNPLNPQSNPPEEHISGSGESRISGAPSSSHLSGQ